MKDAIIALLGVVVGAVIDWSVRKSIETEEVSTKLHHLYTEVETNIIYLENINEHKKNSGGDFQPLRDQAIEEVISSRSATILRGEILKTLIDCQLSISDFNRKIEKKDQFIGILIDDVFFLSLKDKLYALLIELVRFSEKRKFIPTIKIRNNEKKKTVSESEFRI